LATSSTGVDRRESQAPSAHTAAVDRLTANVS